MSDGNAGLPAFYGLVPEFLDYWCSVRGTGRRFPRRQDLCPGEIPDALPFLLLVDHLERRPHVRLAGTALRTAFGQEATDKPLGAVLPPGPMTGLNDCLGLMGRFCFGCAFITQSDRPADPASLSALFLPLLGSDERPWAVGLVIPEAIGSMHADGLGHQRLSHAAIIDLGEGVPRDLNPILARMAGDSDGYVRSNHFTRSGELRKCRRTYPRVPQMPYWPRAIPSRRGSAPPS